MRRKSSGVQSSQGVTLYVSCGKTSDANIGIIANYDKFVKNPIGIDRFNRIKKMVQDYSDRSILPVGCKLLKVFFNLIRFLYPIRHCVVFYLL